MPAASDGALAGIRVVDLTRILAGPFCTQMLGDHGADIIKVEPPQGDETRRWAPPFIDGESAYFRGVNRNKRSLALNLAEDAGREVLLKLLADADVLIENFKAGQFEKWGLDYETVLKPKFPQLVYCQITGFGSTGPLAGRPGFDAIAQVMSGFASINGNADGPPVRVGTPISDLSTALYASNAILMALVERGRSGRGQKVEVSLVDCSISLLHPHGANYLATGEVPRRIGNAHPNIAPYELFETKSAPVFIAGGNDAQFRRLMAALDRPELGTDPRFADNKARKQHQDELNAILRELLANKDGLTFAEELLAQGIPAGPVLDIAQVLDHPQVRHRDMAVAMDGYRGIGTPIKMDRTPGGPRSLPPTFGAHSRAVLAELGYDQAAIDRMIADGTVEADATD